MPSLHPAGRRGHRVVALTLTGVWTVVIALVLDLGAARLGTLRTSAEPYLWTIQGFAGDRRMPPDP